MSNKPESKELATLLAELEQKWQELADLLKSQGQPQERVLEVAKILFRDAAGRYRGKISSNADGSSGLVLSDHAGNAWVRLGVNPKGEAFLELKDRQGEFCFKVPVASPSPAAANPPGVTPPGHLIPNPPPDPLDSPAAALDPGRPAPEVEAPPGGPGEAASPSSAHQDGTLGGEAAVGLANRLEKLERQNRGRWFFRTGILALFGVILAFQAFLFLRPYPPGPLEVEGLVVRDRNGGIRALLGEQDGQMGLHLWDRKLKRRAALGLGTEGSPGLALYDEGQRLRGEFKLGPGGDLEFTLRDQLNLAPKTPPPPPADSGQPQPMAGSGTGPQAEGAASPPPSPPASPPASPPESSLTSPPASPPESREAAVSPSRDAEAEPAFVGSTASNRYHYPTCKLARRIKPSRLITFNSAEEAQEDDYRPCPVCKPPPLGKSLDRFGPGAGGKNVPPAIPTPGSLETVK